MSNVPIEVFLPLIALSLSMGVLGMWKKIPFVLLISGAIITFIAIDTTSISLGKIPEKSVTTGLTTTYTFIDNTFEFTQWHKIFISLIGSIIMFIGAFQFKESGFD